MSNIKLPFEDLILGLNPGDQTIIFIHGRPFKISPAEDDDFDKPHRGYECID